MPVISGLPEAYLQDLGFLKYIMVNKKAQTTKSEIPVCTCRTIRCGAL